MAKVLLVFASMSGNTEEMADAVAEGVREAGAELDVKSVMDASAAEMANYDGVILGAYTWGDGDLPDEFLDFYEEMDDVDLTGKAAAAFGSCDSSYEYVGKAVDTLLEKAVELGASVKLEGLKVELCPAAEEKEACKAFGKAFVQQLNG